MSDFMGKDDGTKAVNHHGDSEEMVNLADGFLGYGSEPETTAINPTMTSRIETATDNDTLVYGASSSNAVYTKSAESAGPPPPSSQSQARTFTQPAPASNLEAQPSAPNRPPRTTRTSSMSSSMTSSFAQLAYRTFETYMNEARADQFPQLELLDDVNLCTGYPGGGLAKLTGPMGNTGWTPHYYLQGQQQPLEPVALRRHIHSTPLRHTPSIVDSDDEDEPPPIGLEILSRSRSTPLSTSKNSAFGTILRTNSHVLYDGISLSERPASIRSSTSSAFSLPPYPISKASSRSSERDVARPVIFNPIKTFEQESDIRTMDVQDGGEEMTSIEVTDMQNPSHKSNKATNLKEPPKKQSPAARAARFLAEVRNLRISTNNNSSSGNDGKPCDSKQKRSHSAGKSQRSRGGRENPAKPPSVSSNESLKTSSAAGSVADETLSSVSSSENNSSETKTTGIGIIDSAAKFLKLDGSSNKDKQKAEVPNEGSKSNSTSRQAEHHEMSEKNLKLSPSSGDRPASVPSPVYHPLEESKEESDKSAGLVCIEVNTTTQQKNTSVSSPEPGQIMSRALTLNSHHSPDSTRYSSTTSSSGHTTQSSRSGYVTQLSVISETDREVADLNNFSAGGKMDVIEMSLSADRNMKFGEYVELVDTPSPVNLSRDGASVQADRFFETGGAKKERRSLSRLRTLPSLNKRGASSAHSPTTVSSASVNTNSSSSSMGSEPPKIVSYFDRKQVSDLTSLHNRGESNSSPRAGLEEKELRDSSPSDQILVGESGVVFEGAEAPKAGEARKPRPMWPGKGLQFGRKIRSLPPRSPHKGLRSSTTPPPVTGGSPAQANLSPQGNAMDHRQDPNSNQSMSSGSSTSTYYYTGYPVEPGSQEVVRLSPSLGASSSSSYVMVPRGLSPIDGQAVLVGGGSPRTYEETSIEILKSHSKDDNSSCNSSSPLPLFFSSDK